MNESLQRRSPSLSAARPNRTKHLVATGEIAVGCLMPYASPSLVEALGVTGYDFVTFDLEHEPFDPGTVGDLIRAAELVGMTAIVRLPASEAVYPLLGAGAQGVWVPDLRGRAHAESIVELTRFAPQGRRTYYTQTRSANYGIGIDEADWVIGADRELLVVAMIEDIRLVEELDEILAVEGIDGFHIGTLDLAQSMGRPSPERVREVAAEIVRRIVGAGRLASVGVVTPWNLESIPSLIADGARLLTVAGGWTLTHALGSFLAQVEGQIPTGKRTTTARVPR
jgi:4-hydroxy-2-oxoheptanedioate aldolase